MKPFSEWSLTLRWSTVTASLGALALAGSAIAGVEQVGSVIPIATKGYVVLIVDEKVAPLLQGLADYGAVLDRSQLSQLELKSTVLLQTQLSVESSLAAAPNDPTLKRLLREITRDLEATDAQILELRRKIEN